MIQIKSCSTYSTKNYKLSVGQRQTERKSEYTKRASGIGLEHRRLANTADGGRGTT